MRTPLDQYPTPAHQTLALLKRVTIKGRILEPCCGDGEIVKALRTSERVPFEGSAFTQDCLCDIADFLRQIPKPL